MLSIRVPPTTLDRMDAALVRYRAYLKRTGDDRTITRSEMVRDIIEFGLEVIERKG